LSCNAAADDCPFGPVEASGSDENERRALADALALWWRVIRWLRKKYERLTWKQLRRRCWGHHWTSREGTRLAWPDEVPVTRYRYRGHRIPSPWADTGKGRATTRPETAVA